MQVKIFPSEISGTVRASASKSAMQRACALALLHDGETIIHNPGQSNDDKAALSIIKNLGAQINNWEGTSIKVTGSRSLYTSKALPYGATKQSEGWERSSMGGAGASFSCGESGLSIRMFTPIAALSSSSVTITGTGSLLTRPMNFFDEILPQLDVSVLSNDGKLPLTVQGPLLPKDITVDGSLSSQFLTGLLIAFANAAKEPVTISVINLKSKPYINLTLQMMEHFGYEIVNNNYESFQVQTIKQFNNTTIHYTVEGDWSGAAFLLVAGAIAGRITVKGLDIFSAQADKAILQALMMSNAIMSITEDEIVIEPASLQPFHFDATDCPDLFPPLVALAAYCNGTSVIEGVSRLAHKESNRALTLQEEFGKMGLIIRLQDDLMIIEGGIKLKGANAHSHHDHRIAMAVAVAALKAEGTTTIEDAEAIDKSYPAFYEHLKQLGAVILAENNL